MRCGPSSTFTLKSVSTAWRISTLLASRMHAEDDLVAQLVDQRALLGDERALDDVGRRSCVPSRRRRLATERSHAPSRGQDQVRVARGRRRRSARRRAAPSRAAGCAPRAATAVVARAEDHAARCPRCRARRGTRPCASSCLRQRERGRPRSACPRACRAASAERSAARRARARQAVRVVARLRAEDRRAAAPRCGERVLPARARPVPFCFQGFLPPPLHEARASWSAAVPARRDASCLFTISCSRCSRTGPAKTAAGTVDVADLARASASTTGDASPVGSPLVAHWSLARRSPPPGLRTMTVPLRAPGTAPRTSSRCSSGAHRDDLEVARGDALGAVAVPPCAFP